MGKSSLIIQLSAKSRAEKVHMLQEKRKWPEK